MLSVQYFFRNEFLKAHKNASSFMAGPMVRKHPMNLQGFAKAPILRLSCFPLPC
jgi:hypothetical protein